MILSDGLDTNQRHDSHLDYLLMNPHLMNITEQTYFEKEKPIVKNGQKLCETDIVGWDVRDPWHMFAIEFKTGGHCRNAPEQLRRAKDYYEHIGFRVTTIYIKYVEKSGYKCTRRD